MPIDCQPVKAKNKTIFNLLQRLRLAIITGYCNQNPVQYVRFQRRQMAP